MKTLSQNEKKDTNRTPLKAFRGQVKGKRVPSFDRLYQEFKNTMDNNKSSKSTTVPEPFSFEASVKEWQERKKNISKRPRSANTGNSNAPVSFISNQSKLILDKAKEGGKRYASNPNLSSSYTTSLLNATCNTTSVLRAQQNKQRLETEISNMQEEEKRRLDAELKQRELRMMDPAWSGMRRKVDGTLDEKGQRGLDKSGNDNENIKWS